MIQGIEGGSSRVPQPITLRFQTTLFFSFLLPPRYPVRALFPSPISPAKLDFNPAVLILYDCSPDTIRFPVARRTLGVGIAPGLCMLMFCLYY